MLTCVKVKISLLAELSQTEYKESPLIVSIHIIFFLVLYQHQCQSDLSATNVVKTKQVFQHFVDSFKLPIALLSKVLIFEDCAYSSIVSCKMGKPYFGVQLNPIRTLPFIFYTKWGGGQRAESSNNNLINLFISTFKTISNRPDMKKSRKF